MAAVSHLARRVTFGPYEVNTATGELTKSGIPIRLAGQPFNLLLVLLARPGHVVSSEELRQKLWGDGTFVDFEHGLHAAINKLRRALGDSAENPRYIETVPGTGYRFIGVLQKTEPSGSTEQTSVSVPAGIAPPPAAKSWFWRGLLIGAACLLCLAAGWLLSRRRPEPGAHVRVIRLTTDAGLDDKPALSRDGRLLAFSSDRSPDGGRDIYIKHVAGGETLQLTFDGLGNTAPDFSPDGTQIVFHSDRDGGGAYLIPTLGGSPHFLTRGGLDPKFSPDGRRIAFWVGDPNIAQTVPHTGVVYTISLADPVPEPVPTHLTSSRYPIWLPDGRRLLFVGYASPKAYDTTQLDWWIEPFDGGEAERTGTYDAFVQADLKKSDPALDPSSNTGHPGLPPPSCWTAEDSVVFSAALGDSQNLWQVVMSGHKVRGPFTRLTTGAGYEIWPACSVAGNLAFINYEMRRDLWLQGADLNHGKLIGDLARLTAGPAIREYSTLSSDGSRVAYSSSQQGRLNVWIHDLSTNHEFQVGIDGLVERYPVLNHSNSKVAFSVYEPAGKRAVFLYTFGGMAEKVCDNCLRATDWSNDDRKLLTFGGNPYRVSVLDLGSHDSTTLFDRPPYALLYARFSPDNQWISFTVRMAPNVARVVIAPYRSGKGSQEADWITIASVTAEDWANWSPDGKTLYFTSLRDGHYCLWGQRLDPSTHRPSGEPFALLHLHSHSRYLPNNGWSLSNHSLAMVLNDDTGTVWMTSRSQEP
jgi:Tol biopolymer transport system component/DNA-binding winged helix-turn-helix (wHTH) protein